MNCGTIQKNPMSPNVKATPLATSLFNSFKKSATSTNKNPPTVYAVALLVAAGADVDAVVEHVDRARAVTVAGNRPRPQLPPTPTER